MGILERIKEIEFEISRTQKNKATEHHLGGLKAKLARLRSELIEGSKSTGGAKGEGFDVARQGDARVCLIGFPSVGKSTLMNSLTAEEAAEEGLAKERSAVGAYEFTTLTCQPSVFFVENTKIQLLDLPGIIEGAAEGRGRGRQVIAVAHSCDLVLMVLDSTKDDTQQRLLTKELEAVGIRLNKKPANVSFKPKKAGGLTVNFIVPQSELTQKAVQHILHQYKIFNADIVVREDCSTDDFIDVIEGNRKFLKCIYVYNKVDMLSIKEIDEIARRPNSVVVSSQAGWNLERLKRQVFDSLEVCRVYTKKKGHLPDFDDPIILTGQRGPCTVGNAVSLIHKDLLKDFKYAFVWGASAKHQPQHVGLGHELEDEDVLQIVKKI
ncbi:developmentally-regulated G-protein 2 [Cyclospora cayetanensis]|uniref:Developmentally-regulated G-protein 2 n=1 Tax=Cyclospora cayetanensis TaxID=88456 RepID=A0A6P6RU26_9EIME|nr:developmentally-regulated G-protein 2 [Cyclospora cayetanensis]